MAKKATQTTAKKENNVFVEATKTPQGYQGDWLIPSKDVTDALKIQFYDSMVSYIWDKDSDSKSVSKLLGSFRTLINKGILASPIGVVLPKESKAVLDAIEKLNVSSSIKKTLKDEFRLGKLDTVEKAKERAIQLL